MEQLQSDVWLLRNAANTFEGVYVSVIGKVTFKDDILKTAGPSSSMQRLTINNFATCIPGNLCMLAEKKSKNKMVNKSLVIAYTLCTHK